MTRPDGDAKIPAGHELCWRCEGSGMMEEPMDNRGGFCTCEECGGVGYQPARERRTPALTTRPDSETAALLRLVELGLKRQEVKS